MNRLDEIIFYKPLTREDIAKIIDIMLAALVERLKEKRLNLEITSAAKGLIAANGYDAQYGARPLRRYIQSKIETLIARAILQKDYQPGDTIKVDVVDGEYIVE